MTAKNTDEAFNTEAMRRFDELVYWAIANWPHKNSPPAKPDFDALRQQFSQVLAPAHGQERSVPEPEADGPQYVSMNPTPWP